MGQHPQSLISFYPGIKQHIQMALIYITLTMFQFVFLLSFPLVDYHLVIPKLEGMILKAIGPVVSLSGIQVELNVWKLYMKISLTHKRIIANGNQDLVLSSDLNFHKNFYTLLSMFLDSNGMDKYLYT